MRVLIYVEGGGVGDHSMTTCRKGFLSFFERLLPGKNRVEVIPCGGRSDAFEDFKLEHESGKPGQYVILLVDSEGPLERDDIPSWDHLRARDNWKKPQTAEVHQAHLVVQCMEAWFMAYREAVAKYFGKGVKISDLPGPENNDIERIAKAKVFDALDKAARKFLKSKGTKKQGYHKVQDGFALLKDIDPEKVCENSKHARRLRETLKSKLPDRR